MKSKVLLGLGCGLKVQKGTGNYCKAQHVYVPIHYSLHDFVIYCYLKSILNLYPRYRTCCLYVLHEK